MAEDMLKGYWKQAKGTVKKHWGKLTDDDLMEIDGNKDLLLGKIQEKYGYTRAEAEREFDTWMATHRNDFSDRGF